MPKRRFSAERIVTLLRQIEVSMGQGNSTQIAYREAGISEQNYTMNCHQSQDCQGTRLHRSADNARHRRRGD
jgi:hypothetical protein